MNKKYDAKCPVTNWYNSEFPNKNNETGQHELNVHYIPQYTQLLIVFPSFDINQPKDCVCKDGYFSVDDHHNRRGLTRLCGKNNGGHGQFHLIIVSFNIILFILKLNFGKYFLVSK